MDKKQALAILGLSGSASFQDARAAFRGLAKQHHPDHFARDAKAVLQAEKQMKAINQAYHLLASVLPRAVEHASSVQDIHGAGRPSGFADMVMRMKKRFWKQSDSCRPAGPAGASCRAGAEGKTGMSGVSGKTGTSNNSGTSGNARDGAGKTEGSGRAGVSNRAGPARNSSSSGPTGYNKPRAKAFAQKSRPDRSCASFEQVIASHFAGAGRKAVSVRGQGTGIGVAAKPCAPYAGFFRYMALKNNIRNRNRFQDRDHGTRVEKISRISPVGRVVRD
ncbi:MAG TPA: DnaJ domain-containing protein [Desulfotignum sp.]|nr:DnaJ domain-containing protein [Desulfotignum sp.]